MGDLTISVWENTWAFWDGGRFSNYILRNCSSSRDMSRNARSSENGKFSENLPKGLTKANELPRRAPSKVANVVKVENLAKMANLAKICQRV